MNARQIPRPVVVPLLTIIILACNAAPAESPGPTAGETGARATPSPSAVSSPTGNPSSVAFAWPDGETPAVTRAMTGLDEAYINPGAVIDHDGELHMFANVFTAWPGQVHVSHLVSTDGGSWSLADEEPVFTSEDIPFARPGADVSTGFVAADGTWILVFETVNAASPWEIGLATAPGPEGPWTVEPEPVLAAGPAGAFDAGGLAWPSVVPTDDGFAMYYSTYATDRRMGVIARATSTDGRTWTKDAEPVLEPEAAWEGRGLDRPRVVRHEDSFVMVYAGAVLTDRGVAISDDGVAWTRDGDVPAITDDDFPVSGRAWDAALVNRDGELAYYLEIGVATQAIGTEIYRATAPLP